VAEVAVGEIADVVVADVVVADVVTIVAGDDDDNDVGGIESRWSFVADPVLTWFVI
jgi:hypothetical protein